MAKRGATLATMKAVRVHSFGGPEVLVLENAPRPQAGEGEVLVRVYAAGVNPIDWKVRAGYMKMPLPRILGWDVAGIVAAVGGGVTRFKPEDAVYGLTDRGRDGVYAEYAAVKAQELAHKPASLDFVRAAAVPLAALAAWQTLFEAAQLEAGQTVLIHGAAGGIGHFAVQFAKWKGARVIGTAAGRDLEFVRQLGADQVIDYQTTKFEDAVSGVDAALDVIGGETQDRTWQVIKKGGILVSTLGITAPEVGEQYGVRSHSFLAHSDGAQLTRIAELIDTGKVKPVVGSILPLAEAAKAHELLQSGQVRGKIVLKVRE